MINKKKLSIIIPVFNVEEYLPKCIESVVNQTYDNLEILLINDGSTDNSGVICDNFAHKDERVKVVHKENGGLSAARNLGLSLATGHYIAFLDSDDYIDSEMYETLVDALENADADIAACGFKEIYQNKTIVNSHTNSVTIYDKVGAVNSLFAETKNVRFEVWNKVFKKEIIGSIRFKDRQIFEDVYFDRNVFLKMNSLVYVDKPMHNYLKERVGNTNSYFNENKLCIFKELDDFAEELKNNEMIEVSNRMSAFALHTTISLYCNAMKLNASKDIKSKLKKQHYKYHYQFKDNHYVCKKRSWIFLKFPHLYFSIYKLKNFKN